MTDKELLELAANAIGHKLYWTGEEGYGYSFLYFGPDISNWTPFSGHDKFELGKTKRWNPLLDDGDALRLAVKLGIQAWRDDDIIWCNSERFGFEDDDPYAATRRAIVRAAAEIGKDVK